MPGAAEDVVECDAKSFQSALDLFGTDLAKLDTMTQAEIDQVFVDAFATEDEWLFDIEANVEDKKVTYMRSILIGAGPVNDGTKRYDNTKDEPKLQNDFATEFQIKIRDLAEGDNARFAKLNKRILASLLYTVYFNEVVLSDTAWGVFSFLFVFFFIWFHLESLFMASTAMYLILMSFPVTYLLFTGVCQVTMNTTLNQLTIFIVLGIAADDIFVFCDAWRQSELIPEIASNEYRRLTYAFKRAGRAIIVTSSTTAVAFLANTVSEIRPIRSFGIFAAIIIPVNFIILILVMPSIQIIHDRHLKERCAYRKCCSCFKKKSVDRV